MNLHPIEPAIKEALMAVRHARDVRKVHARRTTKGTKQREDDLQMASSRVKLAMKPLRSFLGSAPSKTQTDAFVDLTERVKQASSELQAERRKLWKMQDKRKRQTPTT